MSDIKKPTGIIYRAYNNISGKSYIGQTAQSLEIRKKEHLRKAGKYKNAFSRALAKYPKTSWEWSILAKVPLDQLDEWERYFIKDLGTYRYQYNMTIGGQLEEGGCPRWDSTNYELYKPEYGTVSALISTFVQLDSMLRSGMRALLNGKRKHINGWVLDVNKDKYDEIMHLYEFYHPDYGVVKCTPQELQDTYLPCNYSSRVVKELVRKDKPLKQYKGWVLAKYKDNYETIICSSRKKLIKDGG